MAEELTELSPFEKAALTVQLRGLGGQSMVQVMRRAEPNLTDPTYYRRLKNALESLEGRGLVERVVKRNRYGPYNDWRVTKDTAKHLSSEQLLEDCIYLASEVEGLEAKVNGLEDQPRNLSIELQDLRRQLDDERTTTSTMQTELDLLKKEHQDSLEGRLPAKFPRLPLNAAWVEALVLVALIEIMARHKLATLQQGEAENLDFTKLLNTLKKVMLETEGRTFDFNKELVKVLYAFRSKMIHNGLIASVRPKEVEAISALVEDLYQQLFESP